VPILAFALVFLILLLIVASIPVTIVQRYRVGTRRQPVRGWLTTLNVWGFGLSAALFVASAAITGIWVPRAFVHAILGLAGGLLLGTFGLWLTRWEAVTETLYYTANRWLVLAITVAVAARILYSFWRAWASWRSGIAGGSWIVEAGAAEALAAGALALGYYLAYWWGVRHRLKRHRRTLGSSGAALPR
jgi:hypothetical protein